MTDAGPMFEVRAFPLARLPVAASKVYFGATGDEPVELVFYAWLLRSPDTVVLVDTGLPPPGPDRNALVEGNAAVDPRERFTEIRRLDDAYDAWGLEPADVDHAVITQTITYHTGGLLPSLLPRARIHLALPGVVELLTEHVGHPARHLYFTPDAWSYLLTAAIEQRLAAVASDSLVCPGVGLTVTGGHHPGSAAVRVSTERGSLCLLETAFRTENLTRDVPIGVAEHVARARRAMRRARSEHDEVLAIHDPGHERTYA